MPHNSPLQWRLISISLLVAANAILPLAVLCFAIGFFPYKPFIPGVAQYERQQDPPFAPFDKVIFMVVDALRRSDTYKEPM